MPQYIILAQDDTDSEAQSRRLQARPFHLETAKKLRENGNLILGGATLNENEEMIGSVMVVEFENETELQAWLKDDPYVTKGVWKSIEIKPFKVANI